jgi:hypothetical protein
MLPLGTPVSVTPLKSDIDPAVIDSMVSASFQLGPFLPFARIVSYLTIAVAPGLRWVPGMVGLAVDAGAGLPADEVLSLEAARVVLDVLAAAGPRCARSFRHLGPFPSPTSVLGDVGGDIRYLMQP